MTTGKVTISSIAKLDGWLWDTHVTGFGARKQTNGTFYYVRYRHNGTQTVKSIGRHGSWRANLIATPRTSSLASGVSMCLVALSRS